MLFLTFHPENVGVYIQTIISISMIRKPFVTLAIKLDICIYDNSIMLDCAFLHLIVI